MHFGHDPLQDDIACEAISSASPPRASWLNTLMAAAPPMKREIAQVVIVVLEGRLQSYIIIGS